MRLRDLTCTATATGDWCPTCALPSVATFAFYRWTWDGAHLVATVTRCDNPDHRRHTQEAHP